MKFLALLTAFVVAPTPSICDARQTSLEFSERVAAGGPGDTMIARHIRLKGPNEAIGAKLAEIARDRHGVSPGAGGLAQGGAGDAAVLERRREFYAGMYPNHLERARGAARALGVENAPEVDTLALWFNMDIAPGCSVVYVAPEHTTSGHPILSRNFDFTTATWAAINDAKAPPRARSMTGDPYIVEVYPDRGHAALYLCAYDLLGACVDGINDAGLVVALAANESGQASAVPRPGLNELEVARFLLDTCATTDEAAAALERVPVYYTFVACHYIVGDARGRSFIWEYSPDCASRYRVDPAESPQVLTNHPMHTYPLTAAREHAAREPDAGGSFRRLCALADALEGGPHSIDQIKHAGESVRQHIGPTPPGPRTLWQSVYDCAERSLEVDFYLGEPAETGGAERRSGYLRFALRSP